MLVLQQRALKVKPAVNLCKAVVLSMTAVSAVIMTGCASKPTISNTSHPHYLKAPEFYTVHSGDTLSGIAARYGLNYLDVAQLNDIPEPYVIYVNQSLRLTGSKPRSTALTKPVTQQAQIQRQKLPVATAPIKPAATATVAPVATSLRWVKPSAGTVIENFDLAKNIKGIRYAGKLGDPIYAAADGQVVYASDGLKEYGQLVLIRHIDGYITAYAHNSALLVKNGQSVSAGQKIAEMGSSGTSKVMLEFQVRVNGKPINPASILPAT